MHFHCTSAAFRTHVWSSARRFASSEPSLLFRGSPSLTQHSPDPFYTPDLASAIFRGLPCSSDRCGLLPLAIFGLPHPFLAFTSLPTTSNVFRRFSELPRDFHPFPRIPFTSRTFRGCFPTAPGPSLLLKFFFSLAPPKEEGSGYAPTNLIPILIRSSDLFRALPKAVVIYNYTLTTPCPSPLIPPLPRRPAPGVPSASASPVPPPQ